MFKVIRLDGMVLIIPRKFVEELRSLPEHHLSLRHLQVYVSVFFSWAISYIHSFTVA
jgi:uncharacterized protein YlzI (FlbEa/FlbD family)